MDSIPFAFFMDESGNTGEVTSDAIPDFNRQQYFSLGAIGIAPEKLCAIRSYCKELKKKHKIQSEEIKAKTLYKTKPEFIVELLNRLSLEKCPMFIELMDKKYYLCTHIVNGFIAPARNFKVNTHYYRLINQYADFLYEEMPTELLVLFCQSCRNTTRQNFEIFYREFINLLRTFSSDFSRQLLRHTQSTYREYKSLARRSLPKEAHKYFLPLPDLNKRDQIVSLLPHVHAFNNMCLRIERYRIDNDIAYIDVIHDRQDYYSDILLDNVKLMKELSNEVQPDLFKNRTKIPQELTVRFADSKDEDMLQIADVIAGSVMRIWSEFIERKYCIPSEYKDSIKTIVKTVREHPSLGVTFVVYKKVYEIFLNEIYQSEACVLSRPQ